MPEDSNDRVLVDDTVIQNFETAIRYPNNVEDLAGSKGAWQGVASLVFTAGASLLGTPLGWPLVIIGGPSHIMGWAGKLDASAKEFADKLTYVYASQAARVSIAVRARVLRRTTNHVDAVLQLKPIFQIDPHRPADKTSVLYQDSVSFYIGQSDRDKTYWTLNQLGLAPTNELGSVQYSESNSWSAGGGIQVGKDSNVGGSGGYTFTTATDAAVADFNMVGALPKGMPGYVWNARMQNAYTDGKPAGRYNIDNPPDIVVNGAMTRWFKDPPEVAWGGAFAFPLLATFTSMDANAADRQTAAFKFSAAQRVQYGYVAGRWGAPGAKVGGLAVIVPAVAAVSGTLVLDFTKGKAKDSVRIEDAVMKFSTLPEGVA